MTKVYRTFCLASAMALPQFMVAAPIPPIALGQVEATVSFCGRLDFKSADRYKAFGKRFVADMSEKELAKARSSGEYKETVGSIIGELEKLPEEKAVKFCHAALNEASK